MNKSELYAVDCETTGLDYLKNEPVEISIYRFSTGSQKTWHLKPINLLDISADALRVNGLKLEDLKGFTKEGKEKYKEANSVIVEIENWLTEDYLPSDSRILVGQNISFDKIMLIELWRKCGSKETFPFNIKYSIDTMQIEYLLDYCNGKLADSYSLFGLCKKYSIKNEEAHNAASDVRATVQVFNKQIEKLKKATR